MTADGPGQPAAALGVVLVRPASWTADGVANLREARSAVRELGPLDDCHLVVLPELIGATLDDATYAEQLRSIASATGAWVIGGSHHASVPPLVNRGLVIAPDGGITASYQKRNPYGVEHDHGVRPGDRHAVFEVDGRRVAVMICADVWFAEHLLVAHEPPDLLVVPSFSITRRPPAFARALWTHLAVARAYEFTTYVAVADWALGASYHGAPAAGVGGIADPWPAEPAGYFTPAADAAVSAHALDLTKLDRLRADRVTRRFVRSTDAATRVPYVPEAGG